MSRLPQALQDLSNRQRTTQALPLLTMWAYDFGKNAFIYADGKLQTVTGNEALKVWIYFALINERYKYPVNSRQYGTQIYEAIGFPFSMGAKREEIRRYIIETLMPCPYIRSIEDITMAMVLGTLYISVKVKSIYGGGQVETIVQL